jgi:RNA polymerase sigma-70 factor (ECF subfamily)
MSPEKPHAQLGQEDIRLFEALMRRHQDRLYRVAYRMSGNHDDAQDLVQEAVLEAYRSFHRFRPGTHFDRWIHCIMSRTFIDGLRRRPKVHIESLDAFRNGAEDGPSEREIPDLSASPEAELMRSELRDRVQDALAELPEEYRLVFILADTEGMSYEEIAQALGCPIGTVRSRLHRGRALMARRLRPYLNAEEDTHAPNGAR